ncbi:short transient receptor potential channel 4-like isoform X4 [Apostichopus japonicus]|uniref:short transient receptor potential channel 4-like isoform X4 n=1 Tax=Stichopus japonicus TaxID=307972 RepID=UPI003AB61A2A
MFRIAKARHAASMKEKVSMPNSNMDLELGPGKFDSMEKLFLAAAEKGDKKAILYALDNAPDLNINALDRDGRSALIIAIQNGNSDIIEVLLEHKIQLGDALLRAVEEQFTGAVLMICEHIKQKDIPEFLNCRALNGDFHPDITPIVLAAHHNNYDIIKILLEYGARIEEPEYYVFSTETNTLQHSLGLLNIYRALASQAYISLTSIDPINTAFEKGYLLRKLSRKNAEFSEAFIELAEQCEQFAADILGHIRNHKEQTCVLYHDPNMYEGGDEDDDLGPYKVKVAINLQQKKFVSHPHCQQRLTQLWYEGLPRWYNSSFLTNVLFSMIIGMSFPILSCMYIIYPWGSVGRFVRIPHCQFLCHLTSGIAFLILLGIQSTYPTEEEVQRDRRKEMPTPSEWLIVLWVIGLTWVEIKEILYHGSRYLNDRWNVMDFLTLSLYWASIALRIVVITNSDYGDLELMTTTVLPTYMPTLMMTTDDEDITIISSGDQPTTSPPEELERILREIEDLSFVVDDIREKQASNRDDVDKTFKMFRSTLDDVQTKIDVIMESVDNSGSSGGSGGKVGKRGKNSGAGGIVSADLIGVRADWDDFEPMLIAEGLFAIAKVLSFLRPICFTVMSRHVGPMQISLGGMMFDICKFLLIFSFVWFAFSLGMNQLYSSYSFDANNLCQNQQDPIANCKQPFDSIPNTMMTLFWALFGLPDLDILDLKGTDKAFTETVGLLLYAAYHVIAIVVLLNVLIAMMSSTYTRIEEDADIQWKFSRSRLWMSYFEGRGTMPPPFNLIPTPKSFYYFIKWILHTINGDSYKLKMKERNKAFREEREKQYRETMGRLVKRYIFDAKRDDDENNQEQWVNRLKQDISGFKYEMFEALSGMDRKMQDMEHKIEDGVNPMGTEVMHKMNDVIRKPLSRPDSMQSVKSGLSDACISPSQDILNDETSPLWEEFDPVVSGNNRNPRGLMKPDSSYNIAGYMYPPEWEKGGPIRYIDEDGDLLDQRGFTYPRRGSSKKRKSGNHLGNHIGPASIKRKSLKENNTKV